MVRFTHLRDRKIDLYPPACINGLHEHQQRVGQYLHLVLPKNDPFLTSCGAHVLTQGPCDMNVLPSPHAFSTGAPARCRTFLQDPFAGRGPGILPRRSRTAARDLHQGNSNLAPEPWNQPVGCTIWVSPASKEGQTKRGLAKCSFDVCDAQLCHQAVVAMAFPKEVPQGGFPKGFPKASPKASPRASPRASSRASPKASSWSPLSFIPRSEVVASRRASPSGVGHRSVLKLARSQAGLGRSPATVVSGAHTVGLCIRMEPLHTI